MFRKNTLKLWEFAERKLDTPFRCRDIQVSFLNTLLSVTPTFASQQQSCHIGTTQTLGRKIWRRQINIEVDFGFLESPTYFGILCFTFCSPSSFDQLWSQAMVLEAQDSEFIIQKQIVAQVVMHESSLLKENLTVLKEEAEVPLFVIG